MQKIAFSEALKIVAKYYSDAELAKKIGTNRQTVNKWHGMTRQPHNREYMKEFWKVVEMCQEMNRLKVKKIYDQTMQGMKRVETAKKNLKSAVQELVRRHGLHMPLDCVEQWLETWETGDYETFIRYNYDFLCTDEHTSYSTHTNRHGEVGEPPSFEDWEDRENLVHHGHKTNQIDWLEIAIIGLEGGSIGKVLKSISWDE